MHEERYQKLDVWKKSVELVEAVYRLAERLPSSQRFSLCDQMQRSAVSVPANIAEGYGRLHRGDYIHHLSIARGSLAELETHLILAVRLSFLSREEAIPAWQLAQDVGVS